MRKTQTGIIVKLAAALAVLAVGFAPGSFARAGQAGRPEVAIEATRNDFGEVFAGEELSHVFTVRNTGSAPLELSQAKILAMRRPATVTPRIVQAKFATRKAAPS